MITYAILLKEFRIGNAVLFYKINRTDYVCFIFKNIIKNTNEWVQDGVMAKLRRIVT